MITLTTPTGNIGSKLLRQLINGGAKRLRVLARDARKLPAATRERVEVVEGDLHDPAALRKAFAGASAVFWCQPDCLGAAHYVAAHETLATLGCEALRAAGVPRVVAVSAAGATPDRPAGPITALHRMEAILEKSGAACRFLRCGSFFENLLWQWESITKQGLMVYPMPGDLPGPQIATQDIAAVAAGWLTDATWKGVTTVQLPGPRDLTFDEMAAELARHLGRPVRYEAMPGGPYRDVLLSLGYSPDAAQGLVDMFAWLADGYRSDPAADRSLTPTTFPQWLETVKHPAAFS